jgi:hypothetical protein
VSTGFLFDISDGGQLAGAFDLVRRLLPGPPGTLTTVDHPDCVSIQETGV